MKRIFQIVIIIFSNLFFLSCNNTELENRIKGKWEEKSDPKGFSSATFYFWPSQKLQYTVRYFGGKSVGGRYEIKKNTVHLYKINSELKEEEYDSFIVRFISDSVFLRGTYRFEKQVGWVEPK